MGNSTVSELSVTAESNFSFDRSQSFTTGSNSGGYTLKRVDLELKDAASTAPTGFSVTIQGNSGSAPDGTSLGTLTNSDSWTASFKTFQFTSSAGIELDAGTTYWVVIDIAASDSNSRIKMHQSANEDTDGATGWSLGNTHSTRNTDNSDAWSALFSSITPFFLSIHGYAKDTMPPPPSTDTTPPTLVGGTISVTAVNLYFSEPMDTTATVTVSGITLSSSTSLGAISNPTWNTTETNILALTTATAANNAQTVHVSIAATAGVQDAAGNALARVTNFTLTNTGGTSRGAPALSTAEVDGDTLTLTYNQRLLPRYPPAADFTVAASVTDPAPTVTGVAINPFDDTTSTVVLTLSAAVKSTDTVTLSYSKASAPRLQSPWGDQVAMLTGQAVTNSTPEADTPPPPPTPPTGGGGDSTAPRVSGTPSASGSTVTIDFNERLRAGSAPPPEAFEVVVGGGAAVHPSAVAIDASVTRRRVTLTLATSVAHGETVEVRYTRPSASDERLRDSAGNAVADFTLTVDNEAPADAPVADAGANVTVEPGAAVTLDGSGSSDPDGETLTYAWTQVSGGTVTLAGADTATATFTAPDEPGALAFRLTVTDPGDLADSDEVTVTVRDRAPAFGDAAVSSLTLVLDEAMAPVTLPEATGGNGALAYALSSDPAGLAGLSFDAATRMLSGAPMTEGSYDFT